MRCNERAGDDDNDDDLRFNIPFNLFKSYPDNIGASNEHHNTCFHIQVKKISVFFG